MYRHVLITGTTGSGKSHTAALITKRASEKLGLKVVVLDWHGEYTSLLQDYEYIDPYDNPVALFTGDPDDISVLSSILDLTPPQEYLLEKILRRNTNVVKSINFLLDYIESYPEESNWMRETKLSLHRRLSLLVRENNSTLFEARGKSDLKSLGLTSKPVIVDLARIRDVSIRRLYASFLLKRIAPSNPGREKNLLVVLEEAYNYLSKIQPVKPICEMLREIRKFGVGLIIVSQSISQLVDDVSMNTNTKIIHAVKSKQDLEVIEKSLYLDQDLVSVIPYMEPGEAVYSTPSLKKPVLIRIE